MRPRGVKEVLQHRRLVADINNECVLRSSINSTSVIFKILPNTERSYSKYIKKKHFFVCFLSSFERPLLKCWKTHENLLHWIRPPRFSPRALDDLQGPFSLSPFSFMTHSLTTHCRLSAQHKNWLPSVLSLSLSHPRVIGHNAKLHFFSFEFYFLICLVEGAPTAAPFMLVWLLSIKWLLEIFLSLYFYFFKTMSTPHLSENKDFWLTFVIL
jgi:hypothetical protein